MQMRNVIFALALAGLSANCFAQAPITLGATDGPVTIIGAEILGVHSNQAHVPPGASFGIHFLYTIVDVGCPSCIDQIQVGFADSTPTTCAFNGNPGPRGHSGESRSLTLVAPTTPGTYYIAFDRSQDFSCPTSAWWNGTPQPNQYIAAITVF